MWTSSEHFHENYPLLVIIMLFLQHWSDLQLHRCEHTRHSLSCSIHCSRRSIVGKKWNHRFTCVDKTRTVWNTFFDHTYCKRFRTKTSMLTINRTGSLTDRIYHSSRINNQSPHENRPVFKSDGAFALKKCASWYLTVGHHNESSFD